MWIVFLDINQDFERAFQAAKELGLKVLLVSPSISSRPSNRTIDAFYPVTQLTFDSVTQAIKESNVGQIAAFWALRDALVPLASKLTTEFGCSVKRDLEPLIKLTKNKAEMRRALEGTPYNPRFQIFSTREPIERPSFSETTVLKPALGYASIGVEKVLPEGDFTAAVKRCESVLQSINKSLVSFESGTDYDSANTVIAEEYLDSDEFSVEVFAGSQGLQAVGVCGKSPMVAPFFEEISYCIPALIDSSKHERLVNAAVDVMAKLGMKSGMAHVEFRMKGDQPIVLDIGLRLGGSGLSHDLVYAAYGIDLVKAVLAELCGLDSDESLQPKTSDIGLLYLIQVGNGGLIAAIPDITSSTEIKKMIPEFLNARYFVKPGDQLTGYPAYSGLPGFVMFKIKGQDIRSYQRAYDLLEQAPKLFGLRYST